MRTSTRSGPSRPVLRRIRLALPLALLLVPTLASAGGIPWKQLDGADDLLSNEREMAQKVMHETRGYVGCKLDLSACLAKKPRVAAAWRLANYIVMLAGKGLDRADVVKILALRKQSVLPKKVHRIGVIGTPRMGDPKAKVQLVEYADFRCGHCAAIAPILKKVVAKFKDQVALYFKPYPLRPGPSVLAAQAALAADRQGKFWTMQTLLFDNPEQHTPAGVEKLARAAKLDLERFRAAMKDKTLLKTIDQNKIEGLRLGIQGTPTLYVNGKEYRMVKDEQHLRERLEDELELLR